MDFCQFTKEVTIDKKITSLLTEILLIPLLPKYRLLNRLFSTKEVMNQQNAV